MDDLFIQQMRVNRLLIEGKTPEEISQMEFGNLDVCKYLESLGL